jgi:hypothetical protein
MSPSKNATLLKALSVEAASLSCQAAKNQFPVLLQPLAERRRVTAVEFRPLLVDAMLTTHPHGFRILFNSNGYDPVDLQERFKRESPERVMPSRLRFSLAHELAHTLFYDLSDGTPQLARQFRSGGGRTELENLERNCNKLAAQMLLPTPMLKVAFQRMKAVSPQALSELAQRAGVSIEVLMRRLGGQSTLLAHSDFRGCVVLLKETNKETTVTAIAKTPGVNIATGLQLMRPGERWQLAASDGSLLEPSKLLSISIAKLTVETAQSSFQRSYQISQMQVGRSDSVAALLLAFEEIENLDRLPSLKPI